MTNAPDDRCLRVLEHLRSVQVGVMPPPESPRPATVVSELVEMFVRLGVKQAFGVSGGAMAALWDALSSSAIRVYHFRHETGAAFAAIEAGFAGGRPTLLFTTTGPGLTNALTGIVAARDERARLIVVSAHTAASSRGRFAIQETSRATLPPSLYDAGQPFHFATVVEAPTQLASFEPELAAGLSREGGFVAHLALDTAVHRAPASQSQHSAVCRSVGRQNASARPGRRLHRGSQ